jgi:hypothetical protein
MAPAAPDRAAASIGGREDAERVLTSLSGAMRELEFALESETALIGAGRVRDGLAAEVRKSELAADYMLRLQHAKANIVALGRFAPDALRVFRSRQAEFERVIDRNQTVIATAKTIAEGLIRGVSEEMSRTARPAGYGVRPSLVEQRAVPLVFSARF